MSFNGIDILLIEDSIDDAKFTIRAFAKGGFSNKIFHAIDGIDALDFIYCQGKYDSKNINEQPKLILLDLKMPKLSGIDVLKKIKSDLVTSSIPIVILTSSKEDPDIKKCYELGANSYIVKPIESDSFFQMIKELGAYWMISNQSPR